MPFRGHNRILLRAQSQVNDSPLALIALGHCPTLSIIGPFLSRTTDWPPAIAGVRVTTYSSGHQQTSFYADGNLICANSPTCKGKKKLLAFTHYIIHKLFCTLFRVLRKHIFLHSWANSGSRNVPSEGTTPAGLCCRLRLCCCRFRTFGLTFTTWVSSFGEYKTSLSTHIFGLHCLCCFRLWHRTTVAPLMFL